MPNLFATDSLMRPEDIPEGVTYEEARIHADLVFPYSPEGVAAVRALPGARFRAPKRGVKYWTFHRPLTSEQADVVRSAIRIAAERGAAFQPREVRRAAWVAAKKAEAEARTAAALAHSEKVAAAAEESDMKALRKAGLGMGWDGWRSLVRTAPCSSAKLKHEGNSVHDEVLGEVFVRWRASGPGEFYTVRRRKLLVGDVIRVRDALHPGRLRHVRIVAYGRPWSEARPDWLQQIEDEHVTDRGHRLTKQKVTVRWAYWQDADADDMSAFNAGPGRNLPVDLSFLDAHAAALAALAEAAP